MSHLSLLPAHLTVLETWIARIFLALGLATIGPWALFLLYDMLLYLVRALCYEIPHYGGRARGKLRPAAPTLTERPDGRRRALSLSGDDGGKEREGDDEGEDLTEEESRAILSTDLWDAKTDSRFISGAGGGGGGGGGKKRR